MKEVGRSISGKYRLYKKGNFYWYSENTDHSLRFATTIFDNSFFTKEGQKISLHNLFRPLSARDGRNIMLNQLMRP